MKEVKTLGTLLKERFGGSIEEDVSNEEKCRFSASVRDVPDTTPDLEVKRAINDFLSQYEYSHSLSQEDSMIFRNLKGRRLDVGYHYFSKAKKLIVNCYPI